MELTKLPPRFDYPDNPKEVMIGTPYVVPFSEKEKRVEQIVMYDLDRLSQMIKYKGGSSKIPMHRVGDMLTRTGRGAMTVIDRELYFLLGHLGGKRDSLYRPKEFLFANPWIKDGISGSLEIGKECVLWKWDTNMQGAMDILSKYATMQMEAELSLVLASQLSRDMVDFMTSSDADAKAAQEYIDSLLEGKPSVSLSKNILKKVEKLPGAGIADNITKYIEMIQYCKASKFNELGLDANYNMKRESLSMAESQMNDDALRPLIDDIMENAQRNCDETNAMYSEYMDLGPLSVEFNSAWLTNDKEVEAVEEAAETGETAAESESDNSEEQKEEPTNEAD